MTFHAYFQYVCLFIVWLCAISPTRMYAQKYRQQSDTHRTLLVVDKETGRPIEGAYILLENQTPCQFNRRKNHYPLEDKFQGYSSCTEFGLQISIYIFE